MIKNLQIKNFQKWGQVSIDLFPLTVLTGETDSGKSSIFRALEFLFLGQQGYIKTGALETSVTAEFSNGATVSRFKGRESKYAVQVDGNVEVFISPGRDVPKAVLKLLDIRGIESEAISLSVNASGQHDSLVVMGKGRYVLAQAVSAAVGTDVVIKALHLVRDRAKDLKKQDAETTAEIERLSVIEETGKKAKSLLGDLVLISEVFKKHKTVNGIIDRVRALPVKIESLNSELLNLVAALRMLPAKVNMMPENISTIVGFASRIRVLPQSIPPVETFPINILDVKRIPKSIDMFNMALAYVEIIDGLDVLIIGLTDELEELNQKVNIEICPTCGQVLIQ